LSKIGKEKKLLGRKICGKKQNRLSPSYYDIYPRAEEEFLGFQKTPCNLNSLCQLRANMIRFLVSRHLKRKGSEGGRVLLLITKFHYDD